MADEFPEAEITGNDLSPIQPTYVPANVNFEVDDFNDDWLYPENNFDYVHARALYGSVKNWPKHLKRALRTLKPGGWLESVETVVEAICDDNSMPDDSYLARWAENARVAGELSGTTFNVAGNVGKWCEEAGFVEITQKMFKIPIGPWPKDRNEKNIGNFNLVNMLGACEGFSLALHTKYLNFTVDELRAFLEKVKLDLTNRRYHTYFRLYVVTARKPEPESRPGSPTSTLRAQSIRTTTGDDTDATSILEEEKP
ncbi:hypothetical protein ABW19_dt0204382 [Dactylella cylindrospora]|nr:hypothetical protein ABW19_dt0204382 [Dactylella cylindrospora]